MRDMGSRNRIKSSLSQQNCSPLVTGGGLKFASATLIFNVESQLKAGLQVVRIPEVVMRHNTHRIKNVLFIIFKNMN